MSTLRTQRIIAAYFEKLSANDIALREGISEEAVYNAWKTAKRRKLLPDEQRKRVRAHNKDKVRIPAGNAPLDNPTPPITVGSDPLLQLLKQHHG